MLSTIAQVAKMTSQRKSITLPKIAIARAFPSQANKFYFNVDIVSCMSFLAPTLNIADRALANSRQAITAVCSPTRAFTQLTTLIIL